MQGFSRDLGLWIVAFDQPCGHLVQNQERLLIGRISYTLVQIKTRLNLAFSNFVVFSRNFSLLIPCLSLLSPDVTRFDFTLT